MLPWGILIPTSVSYSAYAWAMAPSPENKDIRQYSAVQYSTIIYKSVS